MSAALPFTEPSHVVHIGHGRGRSGPYIQK